MFEYIITRFALYNKEKTVSKEKIKVEENTTTQKQETSTQEGKVGTMLRDVRTKNKISIEQVANDLRIKSTYLVAIENSDYDNIPAHPYGLGFVRSYANYLGLNSTRIAQIFKEETEKTSVPTVKYNVYTSEETTETNIQNRKYIIISFAMLLVGYILWISFSNSEEQIASNEPTITSVEETTSEYPLQVEDFTNENEAQEEPQPQEEQITTTEEEFSETTEKENIPTTPTNPTNNNTKEIQSTKIEEPQISSKKSSRVVLKIKKETWIEVKDSHQEKLWISKVLNAGDEYIVPDNGKQKIVSFGNTDGVDVIIDGKIVTIVSKNKKTNINLDAFLTNH